MARLIFLCSLVAASVIGGATVAEGSKGWSNCESLFVDPARPPFQPDGANQVCREGVLAISNDARMRNPAFSVYKITHEEAISPLQWYCHDTSGEYYDLHKDEINKEIKKCEKVETTTPPPMLMGGGIKAWSQYEQQCTKRDYIFPPSYRPDFYPDLDLPSSAVTPPKDPNDSVFGQHAGAADPNDKLQIDRGHLAPNGLMSHLPRGQIASFTMANIAPQAGWINEFPWAKFEHRIFDWIASPKRQPGTTLHLITGVAYNDRNAPRKHRPGSKYNIPDYYWTVLCVPSARKSMGVFAVNNQTNMQFCLEDAGLYEFKSVADIARLYLKGNITNAATVKPLDALFPNDLCDTNNIDLEYFWSDSVIPKRPHA